MADTLTNITIPQNEWVDLYALSGIAVGTAISVENIGVFDVYLAVQATQPSPDHDAYNIVKRKGNVFKNSVGDSGAWAFCNGSTAKVNVYPTDDAGFYPPVSARRFVDGNGNELFLEQNGGLPVNVQDQTTPSVDLYFLQGLGPPTQLTNDVVIDQTVFEVDSVAFINIGDYLGIVSPSENRFYFGTVLDVGTPTATSVTVDTPLDFAFSAGENVISATRDLNVDGSTTPQVFEVRGGGATSTITLDITRILIEITTETAPDFTDFGDISGGLLKGIVLRKTDGETRNYWNVKSNAEFGNLAYDIQNLADLSPGPAGTNGILVRYTFAGQDKHGVAVRLEPGDFLQLIVQDDLSSLLSFRIIAAGHIVTD
jgi:hypothetical protein